MLDESLKPDLWEILCHYGFDHQLRNKLPEEMKELTEALTFSFAGTSAVKKALENEHILEELADVHIVLTQIIESLQPYDKGLFDKYVRYKVARQLMRIEQERYEKCFEKAEGDK